MHISSTQAGGEPRRRQNLGTKVLADTFEEQLLLPGGGHRIEVTALIFWGIHPMSGTLQDR